MKIKQVLSDTPIKLGLFGWTVFVMIVGCVFLSGYVAQRNHEVFFHLCVISWLAIDIIGIRMGI